ncbi:MAG: Obg family GTPase CgtA [Chloroflexi bacterium]|nr:Obg family GTPase CgtA [Chloroflexota bacterium]
MYIDKVIINIKSGDGGKGSISFNQDSKNSRGGPDGGNGGKGGSIWIICDKNMSSLNSFRYSKFFNAENGGNGSDQKKTGLNGKDLFIKVPDGTLIRDVKKEKNLIAVITTESEPIELFKGGKGGRGNVAFVTSKNKEPLLAEAGEKGSKYQIELDLRFFSNVCLIGRPNSGKSNIIRNISNAKVEVAEYPFTTKQPVLASISRGFQNIKIAEIPGLVSQKEKNLASGNNYLKHLLRTNTIVMVIDIKNDILNEIRFLLDIINNFNPILSNKNIGLILSKYDSNSKLNISQLSSEIINNFKFLKNKIFLLSKSFDKQTEEFLAFAYNSINSFENNFDSFDLPIISPNKNNDKRVVSDGDSFIIKDKQFVQLAEGSNLNNWKTLIQFQYKLKSSKISKELENIGIKRGDTLKIGEYSFNWEE